MATVKKSPPAGGSAAPTAAAKEAPAVKKLRFTFIDEFRGLIGVMMALGHAQEYMNSAWLSFDYIDPLYPNLPQFLIRYMGYLCAPGFLMMNGAMVYWTFKLRVKKGETVGQARWDFIQRGLFLVAVQWIWVNAAWGGFQRLRLDHLGIIATIGISMIILVWMVQWKWWKRLAVAVVGFLIHPALLMIPFDEASWVHYPMQLFIASGEFNLYPVIPWFSLACVGSVMAHFWFTVWTNPRRPDERAYKSMLIGALLVVVAVGLRDRGASYANIFPHNGFFTYSFFMVQKYPPEMTHQFWFSGAVIFLVGLFAWIDNRVPVLRPLAVVGRVPLFFYCVHIPILAIVFRRLEWLPFRSGEVTESLLTWLGLLVVMAPLALWFGKVKRTKKWWIVRMI